MTSLRPWRGMHEPPLVRPHPPTAVAPPLWLPGDRRTQGPGAADSPPSGSCRPGAAPCRARGPGAAPGPDRAPVEGTTEPAGLRGSVGRHGNPAGGRGSHLSVLLLEGTRQPQHTANFCSQTAEEEKTSEMIRPVSPPDGQHFNCKRI